jgi:hypothetical protein
MMGVREVIGLLLKSMPECLTKHIQKFILIMHKKPYHIGNNIYSGKLVTVLCKMPHDVINQIKKEKWFDVLKTSKIEFSNKLNDTEFHNLTSEVFGIECSVEEREFNGYKFYDYELVKNKHYMK